MINLHAADTTSLYSLLWFVTDQSSKLNVPTPSITFDQPMYGKAYNIVLSMNMNMFVRLGLPSTYESFRVHCMLMEESGLCAALENVYATVTVGHMFSGKAFARAICGHMLCASAALSLPLEEFWDSISSDQKSQLGKIFDTFNSSLIEPSHSVKNFVSWLKNKKFALSSKSRISTFWLNYTQYISIVQQFIRAERIRDCKLHVETTKQMLNLFAAAGHNNYAKTCWLYLQSAISLE